MYTNKQFYFSLTFLLLLLFGTVGCVNDFNIEQTFSQTKNNTLVTFILNDVDIREVKTRAVDESTISDAHILIFSTGHYVSSKYSSGSTITMKVPSGSEYSIYIIANTGNSTLFEGSGAIYLKNEATFLKMMQTYDASVDASVNNRLVMTGFKKNVKITGDSQSISDIFLERIVAKINLNVKVAKGLSITGYSIKNLHSLTYLIARPNLNEPDPNDLAVGDDYDKDKAVNHTQDLDFTTTEMSNVTFYMYQNRAGGRKKIAGGYGSLNEESEKAKYAPDKATYIEIRTKGDTYTEAKHRIYLGADNSNNYNIKRNGVYTYYISIKDKMNVDTRIDRLEAPSNCYIVQPNGRVTFPVSRANEDLTERITTTNYTAELLWVDNNKRVSANGTIKSIVANTAYGTVTVDTGPLSGNAVVVVKDGGKIAWSWHIWVADYNPNATSITYLNNGNKNTVFMDRNLGAVNSSVNDIGSLGLLYQWGRKDPFPGGDNFSSTIPSSIYDAKGKPLKEGVTGVKKIAVAVANNLENGIKNPLTIYFNKTTSGDWLSNSGQKNDDLWSGSLEYKKSVYDPCPVGWRVPLSGSLSASPWYKRGITGTYTNGWNWTDVSYPLGWYPSVVTRSSIDGSLTKISPSYWAASVYGNTNNAYSLAFSNSTIATNYYQARSIGAAVRCVKMKPYSF